MADDKIQHGIDDNPTGDAEKGATLGGVGGAAVGAAAGAPAGPAGMAVGAVVGGLAGAAGSGAAVAAVDTVDNDNTVTGIGHGATRDVEDGAADLDVNAPGNGVPGVQTGGYAADGTPDTRGIMEKTADTITGDRVDDKTGSYVANPTDRLDANVDTPGNNVPGVQTGGHAVDGTQDTRGIMEKIADAITGDNIDDKTGKRVG